MTYEPSREAVEEHAIRLAWRLNYVVWPRLDEAVKETLRKWARDDLLNVVPIELERERKRWEGERRERLTSEEVRAALYDAHMRYQSVEGPTEDEWSRTVLEAIANTIFGPGVVQPEEKESDNDKLGPEEGEEVECCGEAATTGDCCGNPVPEEEGTSND